MKEIKSEIQISSNPSKIWETLIDLENWHKWNPITNNIFGKLEIGENLSITMSDSKGNDSKKYNATITELIENQRFSFIATMMNKFLFSAERIIEIKTIGNKTLFIQREIYTGILVSIFWKKLSTDALKMLNEMNIGLKKEIEK